MRKEHVAVTVLLAFSSFYLHAHAQEIYFPGETERPSRFPLNPSPTRSPTGQPTRPTDSNNLQQYNTCIRNCGVTSEYNPVCGSDGVQYSNIGSLNCAVNCGNPVRNLGRAPCTTTTASPATLPPSTGPNLQNGITQQQYNACLSNCQFTAEHNPLCGSDGVQYQNIGSLNCAVSCGNSIRSLGRPPCTTAPPSTATMTP